MGKFYTKRKGFTLVELLVVISIISLLSSVVLVSVQDTRKKARNTQRNQIAEEYYKAIMLAYDANGGMYPNPMPNSGTPSTAGCLGVSCTETSYYCLDGTYSCGIGISAAAIEQYQVTNPLLTAIAPFFGGSVTSLPKMPPVNYTGSFYNKGPVYICASGCTSAQLRWYLEGGSGQKCIRNAIVTNYVTTNSSQCSLALD